MPKSMERRPLAITLTFVPKLVITALVLVLFGGAMMALVGDFTAEIFATIARSGDTP